MRGQIVKIISNLYSVSSNNELYECRARGKFRNEKITPTVGDFVEFDPENKVITYKSESMNIIDRYTKMSQLCEYLESIGYTIV